MGKSSLYPAKVLFEPGDKKYLAENRHWQGIPGIEVTRNGTMYACYYSGAHTEESGNFVLLARSMDGGRCWRDRTVVIDHEDPVMRVHTPCVWLDPLERLWLFWTQTAGRFDGRQGVWGMYAEDPDDVRPKWSTPRRLSDGIMLNKPIVNSNGEWLLPVAVWSYDLLQPSESHPEVVESGEVASGVLVSRDQGRTFCRLGGADVPDRSFDEHMLIERKDGSLWMLVRQKNGIGESTSTDGGYTWSEGKASGLMGANSRFFIRRLSSGRLLLINHTCWRYPAREENTWDLRTDLIARLSDDDGKTWYGGLLLDVRKDVCYPDAAEDANGLIHVIYERGRYREREILVTGFREKDISEGRYCSKDAYFSRTVSKANGKLVPVTG